MQRNNRMLLLRPLRQSSFRWIDKEKSSFVWRWGNQGLCSNCHWVFISLSMFTRSREVKNGQQRFSCRYFGEISKVIVWCQGDFFLSASAFCLVSLCSLCRIFDRVSWCHQGTLSLQWIRISMHLGDHITKARLYHMYLTSSFIIRMISKAFILYSSEDSDVPVQKDYSYICFKKVTLNYELVVAYRKT